MKPLLEYSYESCSVFAQTWLRFLNKLQEFLEQYRYIFCANALID